MGFLFVDYSGIEALAARLRMLPAALDEAVASAAEGGLAPSVTAMLQDACPKRTGQLAASIYAETQVNATGFDMQFKTSEPQIMGYVLHGTGIYAGHGRIFPTSKQALYWPGAPHPFRSIAGMPPNDFITPLLPAITDEARTILTDEVDQAVTSLLGL